MKRVLLAYSLVLAAACGSNSVGADGPCELNPPDPACSIECAGNDTACPSGFYCASAGTCNADCTQGGSECGGGFTCDPRGHCVHDGTGPDGGSSDTDAIECPSVTVTPMVQTPTVQLLIDRSGSMTDSFGSTSRWAAVKTALTGTSGIVTTLQNRVYFGASTYSNDRSGACPDVVSTPTRMFGNVAAINTLLNQGLLTDTPTGESLDRVVADFTTNPALPNSPRVILLATDGLPDHCANVNGNATSQQMVVDAAGRAFTAGIKVYILSVGPDVTDSHLQLVANAGVGQTTGNAPFYKANDPAQLAAALQMIITGTLSCDFDLTGTISDTAAASTTGVVTLGGATIPNGGANGWTFVDGDTIRLLGTSCTQFRSGGSTLSATFECGTIIN